MITKTQKQIRLSEHGHMVLAACKRDTGWTDTRIIETCLAKFALSLGSQVRRSHQLLYDTIVQEGDALRLADSILKRKKK